MFSPMMEIWEDKASLTVRVSSLAHFSAIKLSMSAAEEARACAATSATYAWNVAFFATKSVSALTSTTTAVFSSAVSNVSTIPSAAIRPAFLAAPASPFSLKNSTAFSISPSVAARAFLQSIIPAPVISLNSFTIPAVTAILSSSNFKSFNYASAPSASNASTGTSISIAPSKTSPCFASITASAILETISLTALIASSLPGIT